MPLCLYPRVINSPENRQRGVSSSFNDETIGTRALGRATDPERSGQGASASERQTRPTSGRTRLDVRGEAPLPEGSHPSLYEGALHVSGDQFARIYSGNDRVRYVACSGGSCDVFNGGSRAVSSVAA